MARKRIVKDKIGVFDLLFDHYFPVVYERIDETVQDEERLFAIRCDQGYYWQRCEALKTADYFFDYVSDFSGGLVFGVIDSIEDHYE